MYKLFSPCLSLKKIKRKVFLMLNSKQALKAIHNLHSSIQMKFENSTYTAFFKYIKAHLSETWMIFIDLNDLLVLSVVPRTNQQKYFFWWVIFSFLKEKKISSSVKLSRQFLNRFKIPFRRCNLSCIK